RKVCLYILVRNWTGVTGDVVGAGENDDHSWLQVNNILLEADQHLRSGLAANATIYIWPAWKRIGYCPHVRDGVAEEDDAALGRGRWLHSSVRITISGKLPVVIHVNGDARCAVLIQSGKATGGRKYRLRRLLRSSGERKQQHCKDSH